MIRKLSLYILLCSIVTSIYGGEEIEKWNYSKNIKPSEAVKEYSYLFLDREVYRYLGSDLDSLRIVDEEGNFIPYYFDNFYQTGNKSTKKFKSKRINVEELELTTIEYDQINYNKEEYSIEEKVYKSVFDFQVLPTEEEIAAETLKLKIDGDSYSKQIQIFGRNEKSDWNSIGSDSIYNFDGYTKTDIKLDYIQRYTFYRLVIYNNKENLDIKKLDLVLSNETVGTKNFVKSTDMKFEVTTENKKSIISIPNPDKLKITSLKITAGGQYKRSYSLKRVVGEEEYYTSISGKLYNFQYDNIDINSNTIDFNNNVIEDSDEIIVIINNKDNPPLKINQIEAEYLIDKIVFKSDMESEYKLLFGNDNVKKPAYDIEDFKEYIKKEDLSEALLSDVEIRREVKDSIVVPFQLIFNTLIVIIAIVLFIVIIIKMKPKKNS